MLFTDGCAALSESRMQLKKIEYQHMAANVDGNLNEWLLAVKEIIANNKCSIYTQ